MSRCISTRCTATFDNIGGHDSMWCEAGYQEEQAKRRHVEQNRISAEQSESLKGILEALHDLIESRPSYSPRLYTPSPSPTPKADPVRPTVQRRAL